MTPDQGQARISQAQAPVAVRRQRPVGPAIEPSGQRRFGIRIGGPHSVTSHGAGGGATSCGGFGVATSCGGIGVADPAPGTGGD